MIVLNTFHKIVKIVEIMIFNGSPLEIGLGAKYERTRKTNINTSALLPIHLFNFLYSLHD